jgi:hypothetical protein
VLVLLLLLLLLVLVAALVPAPLSVLVLVLALVLLLLLPPLLPLPPNSIAEGDPAGGRTTAGIKDAAGTTHLTFLWLLLQIIENLVFTQIRELPMVVNSPTSWWALAAVVCAWLCCVRQA